MQKKQKIMEELNASNQKINELLEQQKQTI